MACKPRMRKRRSEKAKMESAQRKAAEATNTEGLENQVSWDELADIQADDVIDAQPTATATTEAEVISEPDQQWPPKQHPRDETGVTTKEADILTQRAIRHGWVHAPFLTHVPKAELEQIPEEDRTLEHKAVLGVHDGLDAPSIKTKGRAAATAVLMVRANIAANQQKPADADKGTTINGNVTVQQAFQQFDAQEPEYREWKRKQELQRLVGSADVGRNGFKSKILAPTSLDSTQ